MTKAGPPEELFLGIDLGTSALKTVLVNPDGDVCFEASAEYAVSNPQPMWSEQDPRSWWQALGDSLEHMAAQGARLDAVRAIGTAGQMHGAVLLDSAGTPLRPAILWNDGRSDEECRIFETRLPEQRKLSGNLCMPGFTAPKLIWVERNEPEVFKRVAKVLLPKDYLSYRLSGDFLSDFSDASGTLWLNPQERTWDDRLLAASHLTREHVPEVFEGCQQAAQLSPLAAAELGLRPGIPLVAGAGDNAASAVSLGITEPGAAFLSLGTSGVLFAPTATHRPLPDKTLHAFCHCLPDRWHHMAVTLSASDCLRWLGGVVGRSPAELDGLASARTNTRTSLLFLPYLSGERTPLNDPDAVGVLFGLRVSTTLSEMVHAVMEGVAFSFVDGLETLAAAETYVSRLTILGGGAGSAHWRQICADALGLPLDYRNSSNNGPALGAARLAIISCLEGGLDERIASVCRSPAIIKTHEPNASRHEQLRASFENYRSLYTSTRDLIGGR